MHLKRANQILQELERDGRRCSSFDELRNKPMKDFEGKVALITGATTGMGRATAIRLAERGAKIVVAARREQEGEETVELVRQAGSDGLFVQTDVTVEEQAKAMVDQAIQKFGRLDIAFNNAGAGVNVPIAELGKDDWNRDIAVNLTGVYLGLKYEIPAMLKTGGGAIVNMSLQTATMATPGYGAYAAAKAGVEALTRVVAVETAKQGIRVNSVAPGIILTDILKTVPETVQKAVRARIPMARPGEVDEVAQTVVFLLSSQASFITGKNLLVDGGYTSGITLEGI